MRRNTGVLLRRSLSLVVVLAVVSFTACGDDFDKNARFFDEIEPNDDAASFNLIERNVDVRGTTGPGDVDGFCASVTEASRFVSLTFPPRDTEVFGKAEAFDGFITNASSEVDDGVLRLEGDFTPDGARPEICFSVSYVDGPAGPYTLEIRIED